MSIYFFNEDISFLLKNKRKTTQWIEAVCKKEKQKVKSISIIFCSDSFLFDLNKKYLNHDTFTDIITFDYTEEEMQLQGDIFISIDRIKENAIQLKINFQEEIHRVIIHGILHLLGYGDKTKKEKEVMREKENTYLKMMYGKTKK